MALYTSHAFGWLSIRLCVAPCHTYGSQHHQRRHSRRLEKHLVSTNRGGCGKRGAVSFIYDIMVVTFIIYDTGQIFVTTGPLQLHNTFHDSPQLCENAPSRLVPIPGVFAENEIRWSYI